jgi:alkanesulfonate monooxygenase SsuD/methylene tetrahydromethanopterin reductase-like flavin-dependent oxidoreductase (luciferase family)
MGAREVNFHNEHMRRMGYAEAAERIQELFLAGRKDEAIAAVPDEYVDERCLVGPADRIRSRYEAWADSGISGLSLSTRQPQALELLAERAREHPARGVDAVSAS